MTCWLVHQLGTCAYTACKQRCYERACTVYKRIIMQRHDTNQRAFWDFVCEQVTLIDTDLCSCDKQRQT